MSLFAFVEGASSYSVPDDIRVHRLVAPHGPPRILSNFVHQLAGVRYRLALFVDNVFDKDPPFLPTFDISRAAGTLNTFPTYDVLGRRLFLAVRATF